MVRITGTRYCGNIYCQPFVQYLDLSLRFNETMPPAHRARKMVALLLLAETPDFIGLQYCIREKGGHFEHQILTLSL